MNKLHRYLAVGSMLMLVLITSACDRLTHCGRLETKARNPEVQVSLRSWVETNLADQTISADDVMSGDGVWPGVRWLPAQYDWQTLDIGSKAHVRLIGPSAEDRLEDTVTGSVQSVYFGSRTRKGIVVLAPDSTSFGLDDQYLYRISDDVAVLCRPGD